MYIIYISFNISVSFLSHAVIVLPNLTSLIRRSRRVRALRVVSWTGNWRELVEESLFEIMFKSFYLT